MTPRQKEALKELREFLLETKRELDETREVYESMYRSLDQMGLLIERIKQQERAARPFSFLRSSPT